MAIFARPRTDLPHEPDRWKSGLEAALRISEIASSAAPLAEAVDAMLRTAIELLGAEQGSIMLVTDGGRELEVAAACGFDDALPAGGQSVAVGESVAGRVIATGQALRLGKVDGDAFVNFVPKSRDIGSSVVVPLRVHGEAIGVLNLNKFELAPFTDEDVRVAQMFADQSAGVIYRAKLHERAEQRSSDLMALMDSSRGLVGTLGTDELLQRMLDGGTRLAGSKNGFACLFDPDTGAIAKGVFRGMDKPAISALVQSPEVKKAVQAVDVLTFDAASSGAHIALGIRTSHGTKGVVVVEVADRKAEERADLFRVFAQQCSSAAGASEFHSQIELKESQLSSIINGVPNPIVLVDSRKLIVALNSAAEGLFGVSSQFSSGGAPAGGALGHQEVERLLTGEGELQGEVVAGNPPRTFKVRVIDVRVPGAPFGRVLLMDDITSEREIVQMQRDFVAMVGHELRTPLTIIKGFAWTLRKRVAVVTPDETRDVADTIVAKADKLDRLIEDLLYVSSVEAREATLRIERVEIPQLVRTTAQEVVRDHQDREVLVDASPDLTWPCDETKIGLVLRHLLDNALKFSEPPEPVRVHAFEQDGYLRVDVKDAGVGMVSSDVPRVFQRFRQLDNSSTRAHGGTGVGLYLAAQLIKMHHGRIWVDSTWGKGSTFSIALPASAVGKQVVHVRHADLNRNSA